MHKYTNFFLAALFVCGTWSNCPAETESVSAEPECALNSAPFTYYGHETQKYKYENVLGGPPVKDYIYIYAIPCPDSAELSRIDKPWGVPHVTIGRTLIHTLSGSKKTDMETKAKGDFNGLKSFLSDSTKFDTTDPWKPTDLHAKPEGTPPHVQRKCKNKDGILETPYHGFHFSIDENKTPMGKIITQIQAQDWSASTRGGTPDLKKQWFYAEKKGDLHISAVASGATLEHEDQITAALASEHWHLALVKVNTDATKFDYLATFPIYNSNTNPIPEPTTLLLALLALVAVPLRVRCG